MKFSIICVFNNFNMLTKWLTSTLEQQTMQDFETIFIDNRKNFFKSAASALNHGAKQATGEYLIFAHQDVRLHTFDWLEKMYTILKSNSSIGVIGCAGATPHKIYCGVCNQSYNFNSTLIPVQTLDELILITPKTVFDQIKFDEKTFSGWHCYGCDYSLAVTELGLNSYVTNIGIYHESHGASAQDGNLLTAQEKLQNKWQSKGKIYTTCGPSYPQHERIKFTY